jgi:L-fuconolactonase
MFGSDWPVCLLASSYGQTIAVLKELLSSTLDDGAERKLFRENAARFYKLDSEAR